MVSGSTASLVSASPLVVSLLSDGGSMRAKTALVASVISFAFSMLLILSKFSWIISGVGGFSGSPIGRPLLVRMAARLKKPKPALKICPVSLHSALHRYKTMGDTNSGLLFSKISGGMTSRVSLDAAMGAMVFTLISYLAPSVLRVFIIPTIPSFAVE